MLHISKILVPYDFSTFSKKALHHGLDLSQLFGAELHIVYIEVLHQPLLINPTSLTTKAEGFRKKIEEDNFVLRERFKDIVIHYAVGQDLAAGPSILEYAEDYNIDLIVMGTHGRHGIKRMFLGSIAEEIVRHAACPVMTVRDPETKAHSIRDFKQILVPVDFSIHSKHALEHAHEIASLSSATLDLLHVIPVPSYPVLNDTSFISLFDDQPGVEQMAFEQLNAFYNDTVGTYDGKVNFTISHGVAADEIIQRATENSYDLIVIGTHGQTGIDRFLLGSVTSKVVRHAPNPVFVVKSFGKSLRNPHAREDVDAKGLVL